MNITGILGLVAAPLLAAAAPGPETVFVAPGGEARAVREIGAAWRRAEGCLEGAGVGNYLHAGGVSLRGDFRIRLRLSITPIDHTAASFVLGADHFGFDGAERRFFVEGPTFGRTMPVGPGGAAIRAGEPFEFEVVRAAAKVTFRVNGANAALLDFHADEIFPFGLRPWRATMRVYAFSAEGCATAPAPAAPLFVAGTSGYHTYRIPALLSTAGGTLLAFCEGRVRGVGDSGDIDLLMRRSRDGGVTWDAQRVVWDDGANTCGNPCPVQERETGTVWLLMTWNRGTDSEGRIIDGTSAETRRVFVTSSRDDGATWETPREITADVKRPGWTWYATGPCTGIQLRHAPCAGRLLVPCDHIEAGTKRYYSHVIYSDDHGASWKLGGRTPTDQVNECQAVELADGRIMLNMRNYDRSKRSRAVAVSADGGATWSAISHDAALIEPICQASLIGVAAEKGGALLLFSNPAHTAARVRMTVRASRDSGREWFATRLLHGGPAAYSSLAVLPGGDIGCLYECGERGAYERIALARFSLQWLLERS